MISIDQLHSVERIPLCALGEKQALPTDFEHTRYVPVPLLSPRLVGTDIGSRIATFAMTNAVPIETTLVTHWTNAVEHAAQYLERRSQNESKSKPDIYVISGTVSSNQNVNVIGNGVHIPKIVWMAVCGYLDNEMFFSFGFYANNQYEQKPRFVSVQNLQDLLNAEHEDDMQEKTNVVLFPGKENLCSLPTNDVSFTLQY